MKKTRRKTNKKRLPWWEQTSGPDKSERDADQKAKRWVWWEFYLGYLEV